MYNWGGVQWPWASLGNKTLIRNRYSWKSACAFCSDFTKLALPNHLYPDCAHWEMESVEHMVCYHHLQHPTCTGTDTCTALLPHALWLAPSAPKNLHLPSGSLCSHMTHFKLQLIYCIWTEETLNCQTPNCKLFKDTLIKHLHMNPSVSRDILLSFPFTKVLREKREKRNAYSQ